MSKFCQHQSHSIIVIPPLPSSQQYCTMCLIQLPENSFPRAPLGRAPYRVCNACKQRNRGRDRTQGGQITPQTRTRRPRRQETSHKPELPAAFLPVTGICNAGHLDLGPMDDICKHCSAFRWLGERRRNCYKSGTLYKELFPKPPSFLCSLLLGALALPSLLHGTNVILLQDITHKQTLSKRIYGDIMMPFHLSLYSAILQIGVQLPAVQPASRYRALFFIQQGLLLQAVALSKASACLCRCRRPTSPKRGRMTHPYP